MYPAQGPTRWAPRLADSRDADTDAKGTSGRLRGSGVALWAGAQLTSGQLQDRRALGRWASLDKCRGGQHSVCGKLTRKVKRHNRQGPAHSLPRGWARPGRTMLLPGLRIWASRSPAPGARSEQGRTPPTGQRAVGPEPSRERTSPRTGHRPRGCCVHREEGGLFTACFSLMEPRQPERPTAPAVSCAVLPARPVQAPGGRVR